MHIDEYEKNYNEFHMRLLNRFIEQAAKQIPFCLEDCAQYDSDFMENLKQLLKTGGTERLIQGQELMCKIVAGYPQLMFLLPRDLLWFFGGDCLHYMPDEEISLFQLLDEQRHAAQITNSPFNYESARAAKLGLN